MEKSSRASVGLRDWVEASCMSLSSNEVYLRNAVEIASTLTYRLCEIAQDWQANPAGPLSAIHLYDILPENVEILYVENTQISQHHGHPTIMADFRPRSEAKISSNIRSSDEVISVTSCATCSALGEILLEIFSKGLSRPSNSLIDGFQQACFPDICNSMAMPNISSQTDLGKTSEDVKLPPSSKRKLKIDSEGSPGRLVSRNSSLSQLRSSAAKKLLRELEMPLSICRLVSDLLDSNCTDTLRPDSAFTSLEDAKLDLNQMREHPELFLFDCVCPDKALENLPLFYHDKRKIWGREVELDTLKNAARRVSYDQLSSCDAMASMGKLDSKSKNAGDSETAETLCEAVFISGHTGSGKSSLIRHFIQICDKNKWFILSCKFDHQSASFMTVAETFGKFFQHYADLGDDKSSTVDPSRRMTLIQVARSLITSIDNEGLSFLSELIPNLCHVFTLMGVEHNFENDKPKHSTSLSCIPSLSKISKQDFLSESATIMGNMGSGRHRLQNLFHLLVKSLCSSSNSVVIVFDNLQWADDLTLEVIRNFIETDGTDSPQGKLLILGSFSNNQVSDGSPLANQIKLMQEAKGSTKVTNISVGQLSKTDINDMLSFGLCLPVRLTRGLAGIVHNKTMGNPLFVIEFLKSLVQNKLLTFSVKHRRWIWDGKLINSQVMSNGVVELLTNRIHHMSSNIIETLKIISCFGSQVEESTMKVLSPHFLPHDILRSLDLATREGLIEKRSPIYEFSHDIMQKSIYELMPVKERMAIHKEIGTILTEHASGDDHNTWNFLAADQINICKNHIVLSPEERSKFVELNFSAGKHAITLSCFEQAHSYIEAGLSLLEDDHWDTQYYLSLGLHELSVVLSFMGGKDDTMSNRLTDILLNVKTYQGSLTANALLVKFLAFSGRYVEAVEKCLEILSELGEAFPCEVEMSDASNEITNVRPLLADITKEDLLRLPKLTDGSKLNVMKFLTLLCRYSFVCKPILWHLVSSRMVKLTLEYGFCDDSIVGLVNVCRGLIGFTNDIQLANRLGAIAECLIKESPNEHALRAMLSTILYGFIRFYVEPAQSLQEKFLISYDSGMLAGDAESSMFCYYCYVCCGYYIGMKLSQLNKIFPSYLQEMAKHKQYRSFYLTMSIFHACTELSGSDVSNDISNKIGTKNYKELFEIGEQTNDVYLLFQSHIDQISIKFWMRDFKAVVILAQQERALKNKRFSDIARVFYEGIAALRLARDTKQDRWKQIGEKSVETMSFFAKQSPWNFENTLFLLRAELHYTNGDLDFAEFCYEYAIVSAIEHRFLNEEALAHELLGIFLLENTMPVKALKQLHRAHEKYTEWGALKKADAVMSFINNPDPKQLVTEMTGEI